MKTTFKFIAAALAIVAAASCSKEIAEIQETNEPAPAVEAGKVFKTFTGTSDATKGDLVGLTPTWEVGDSLVIYDNVVDSIPNKFMVTAVSGANVTFQGLVSEGATAFRAVYPFAAALENHSRDSVMKVTVSGYQKIPAGKHIDPRYMLSVATSDGGTFQFKNAISLAKFTVTESNVKKVKIFAAKGNFWVKPSDATLIGTPSYNPVEVTPLGSTYFTPGDYYIAVQPCSVTGMTVITQVGNDLTWKQNKTLTFNFERNGGCNIKKIDDGNKLLAKWSFKGADNETTEYFVTAKTKASGYGTNTKDATEAKVSAYLGGYGLIKFYRSNSTDDFTRKVETSGDWLNSLSAGGTAAGDFYEFFTTKDIASGTKLHIWFKTSQSGSGTKNWQLKYYDVSAKEWKAAGKPVSPGHSVSTITTVEYTATTTAAITASSKSPVAIFRFEAVAGGTWGRIIDSTTDNGVDEAPYIEILD